MTTNAQKIGVIPPPHGMQPDFSGDRTDLQNRIIVVYVVMTVISTIVLALRLYTRICIRHTTGLDDALVLCSWMGCVAWLVICFEAFQYGFGQHLWNVTPEQVMAYTKILVGIMVVYVWTPALAKLSLLALYYRLNPDRTIRMCIYGLAGLVFGYSLSITVVAAGPCNPQTHTDQKCLTDLNLFMACINIITDFLILCLPIPMLRALQLPLKQKVLLGLVFALGSGVVVISTVRIIYVYSMISNPDSTYNVAKACIFSTVELNGGVICACVALLKPFIQQYMPWILSLSSKSGSGDRSMIRKFRMLVKRGTEKEYELQSPEAETAAHNQAADKKSSRQIAVTRSYSVEDSRTGKSGGDSMDELFAPDAGWNNGR
ncbi:hypothetical protein PtrSN002B_006133 [Pyrenophora tritici-repentis]|uniref:Uncharacterized protein n=1 Tax=Pyrenophora tritici-repentis TaxID=45151 RepID=A0A2W1E7M0_9PLEO|nr:hypothetical protein PtrV1_00732 [Pyrenophora tritici-repentis]KAF7453447.1 hypothetical protein A1F99_007050 [Pyrenophora tritici-repentis]KAF7576522.1 hypothetical protein PtrM4_007620 [Pyrenophora tritici-repentis]KAI0589552.1 hypothetical protein Alg215_00346 [Pyrenophora tritici-repentis]KAI0589811.1 hypothetical protein Alg130_02779 [Pyrenophora tritici-repentis]